MINKQLGMQSTAGQEYMNSPLTVHVRQARGNNQDFSGVNYATFFVSYKGRQLQVTQGSNQYHSEKHCWLALCSGLPEFQALRVRSWSAGNYGGTLRPDQLWLNHQVAIAAVYTERDACSGCSPLLDEILMPDITVWWSYVYPSADTSKYEQTGEQVAMFSLLNLGPSLSGVSFEQTVQDYVRQGRVLGNKDLKTALNQL
jgi:hypothetical protein